MHMWDTVLQRVLRHCAGAQVVNLIKAQIVLNDIETVLPPADAAVSSLVADGEHVST